MSQEKNKHHFTQNEYKRSPEKTDTITKEVADGAVMRYYFYQAGLESWRCQQALLFRVSIKDFVADPEEETEISSIEDTLSIM